MDKRPVSRLPANLAVQVLDLRDDRARRVPVLKQAPGGDPHLSPSPIRLQEAHDLPGETIIIVAEKHVSAIDGINTLNPLARGDYWYAIRHRLEDLHLHSAPRYSRIG